MLLIGITGGIGSGKTSAAKIIQDMGYKVIFTDDRAKELMQTNAQLKSKLIAAFGKETFLEDGALNRGFLSGEVFCSSDNKQKLSLLNSIVHPFVIQDLLEKTDDYEKAGEKIIFVESALIFEAHLEDGFDNIIVVDAEENKCIERTAKRLKISLDEAKKRLSEQIPPDAKRANADFVIENNGSHSDLQKSVEFLMPILNLLAV